MERWLRLALLAFGLVACCVLSGIVGSFATQHITPMREVSYADFIVIILTALAVIMAALTLFIGILAYLGWNTISRGALQKAEQIIKQELVLGGKLRAVVIEELRGIEYSGIEEMFGGDQDSESDR